MRLSFSKPDETQGGWTPLPAGTYDCQVDEVDGERTTSKGNPQVMVKAHVVGGDYDAKKVTIFYVLAANSTWRFKKLLDATGTQYTEAADNALDVETDDLLGCYFTVDITKKVYNGKEGNDFANERASALSATQEAAPAIAQPATAPKAAPAAAPAKAAPAAAQALPQRRARA